MAWPVEHFAEQMGGAVPLGSLLLLVLVLVLVLVLGLSGGSRTIKRTIRSAGYWATVAIETFVESALTTLVAPVVCCAPFHGHRVVN
jgi:hypothetical protein